MSDLTIGKIPVASAIDEIVDATRADIETNLEGGVGLNALSASNLASGTVPDARFPSTLPALNGSLLTSLTGANLTGTINDARLSGNVTLLGNSFNGSSQLVQLNVSGQLPALDGHLITALNATALSSGTVNDARLSANVPIMVAGVLPAVNGSLLTNLPTADLSNLNATNLTSGTVPLARLSGITNTEISASAAIAVSKLGTGGTIPANSAASLTGLPISTGVSGLGTGIATALSVNTGSAGAPVLFNGAGGTPSSITLTNATNIPAANLTGTIAAISGVNLTALNATNLASGTTAVARGGTGLGSGTSGGILGFTATGALASSGALTANALLLGGGAGATPSAMGSLGTTAQVLHGNAAGAPTWGPIVNADITNATIDLTTKVTGTLPVANGGTGITSFGTGVATALGNNTNGASGVVVLDASAKLPAVDGSALTNLPGGGATYVYRTADSSVVTGSTAYVDDGVLQFAVSASKDYTARFVIRCTTNASADIKFQITGPASPTLVKYVVTGIDANGAQASFSPLATAFSTSISCDISATTATVFIDLIVRNGTNAGTVKLQFAQNTSNGVSTFISAGSILEYKQLN